VILLLDNYDSFTYNLVDLFSTNNVELKVIRNDELTLPEIIKLFPTAIVISPGPGRPENAGVLMELINEYVTKIPMLGICLGHQALCLHFGANLVHAEKCMHGKVSAIKHNSSSMFKTVPQLSEMMRYHSLIIEDLPASLQATAHTEGGELMAVAHKDLPIWGLQFHPESVLSTNGPQIIRNWLTHFQLIK
jgi:anthranilate synthase/aminodeoxychorismate synthase-like glutamine amidotransferase